MEDTPRSHPTREWLHGFALGQLGAVESVEVEAHVLACQECCACLAEMNPAADPFVSRLQKACCAPTKLPQYESRNGEDLARVTSETAAAGLRLPSIPGYEVLAEVGRGGMAVVYRARHLRLGRLVALKMILDRDLAGPEHRVRLTAEAGMLAQFLHPNIVPLYEMGEHEGRPYLALEYVPGGNLEDHLAGKPQPAQTAAELIETLARALHHAHEKGIVHRDLKPANVLLTADRTPKITDFGLAKQLRADLGLTRTGVIAGTPSYMAPEQARGLSKEVGPGTDVYALGAVLYRLLTARPPFQGLTASDTLVQVLQDEPVPPRRLQPRVPAGLQTICLKCLRKEPHQRYPSALALAEDLARFREGRPILARPPSALEAGWRWCRRNPLVAGLLAALVVVVVGGFAGITWNYLDAEHARLQESQARIEESRQRQRAEANLYQSRIALAEREWLANNVSRADYLLDQCIPQEGRPDLRGWEWHYFKRLCHADLLTFSVKQPIHGLTYSPDGKSLVIASGAPDHAPRPGAIPGELTIWDPASGQKVGAFVGHTGRVTSAAFSRDGKSLISLAADKTVRLWDVATQRQQEVFAGAIHWESSCAAFSPDGKILATPDGSEVKLRDRRTGEVIGRLGGHKDWVGQVVFSPDGTLLASVGGENTLYVWDMAARRLRYCVTSDFSSRAHAVAFSPDGKLLATTHAMQIRLWNVDSGRKVEQLRGHNGLLRALAWAPDSKFLASAADDQTVRLWDVSTGEEKRIYRGHTAAVMSLAYHPSGSKLASADAHGVVKQWDAARDQRARAVQRAADLSALVFTADSRELRAAKATGAGKGGAVRGWDATTGELRLERQIFAANRIEWPLKYVDFNGDGGFYAAPANEDPRKVNVWDVATGKKAASFAGHRKRVRVVAMSQDGQLLASASPERSQDGDRELFVWRVESPRAAVAAPLQLACRPPVQCLAFSRDGRHLVSGDWGTWSDSDKAWRNGCLNIWDSATGRLVRGWIGHPGVVQSVAFDPQGRYVASAGHFPDNSVRVWDVANGQLLHTLHGPFSLTCVTFSPDGKRLVSVGYEGVVHMWDPATGQDVLTLRGLGQQMPATNANETQVVFSPDGTQLAVNSWRGVIYIWDGRPLAGDHVQPAARQPVVP